VPASDIPVHETRCVDEPVAFRDGKGCGFADIGTGVRSTFPDGKHHYAPDHRHLNTAQNTEGHGSNERIGIIEVLLEGVDGKESKIGLLLCISQEIYVDEFSDFQVRRSNIFDDVSEILGYIASFRDQLKSPSVLV
jgi:hypothetical protein